MLAVPCSNCYFPAGGSLVLGSQSFLNVQAKGGAPAGYNISASRAFIPYIGVGQDASGAYTPLTVASNIAQKKTFYDWFNAAWYASNNYVKEDTTHKDLILNGNDNQFASYLAKRLGLTTATIPLQVDRFHFIASLIFDFWTNANAAWTGEQYQAAVQNFIAYLKANADFNSYLAPADYQFLSAAPTPADSGLGADILAWKTADVNFVGFGAIEIYI